RLELRNAGPAFGTGEFLRVQAFLAVHDGDNHQAVGQFGSRFDARFQPFLDARLDQKTVDYNLNRVILALVEDDFLVKGTQGAIDSRADEALLGEPLQLFLVFTLAPADHGREDHNPLILFELVDLLEDLFGGLARDLVAAVGAIGRSDRRVKQPYVVVDFGDG